MEKFTNPEQFNFSAKNLKDNTNEQEIKPVSLDTVKNNKRKAEKSNTPNSVNNKISFIKDKITNFFKKEGLRDLEKKSEQSNFPAKNESNAKHRSDSETLFPGFNFFESPTLEKVEKMNEMLSKYPELKPQMTFIVGLNERRKNALKMIKTGEINQNQVLDLLESKDIIEQDSGLRLLMEKTHGVSQENIQRLQSILANNGSKDEKTETIERIKVKIILETQKEKAPDILKKLVKDKKWETRKAAIEGLGIIGDKKFLPLLEDLCKDRNPNPPEENTAERSKISKSAAKSAISIILNDQKEKSFEKLSYLLGYGKLNEQAKKEVAKGLGRLENTDALDVLNQGDQLVIFKDGSSVQEATKEAIISVICNIAKNQGEKAIPQLKELCGFTDNRYVRQAAAKSWARIIIESQGEKAPDILEKTFQNYGAEIQDAVNFEKNKHQWLLVSQKPMFATPHTKELAEKFLKLEKITQQIKNEFKDGFFGLIVYGSSTKGYYNKTDLDYKIIVKNTNNYEHFIYERFAELMPQFHSYESHGQIIIDENKKIIDREHPDLFSGLFLGDREELFQIQKNFLDSIDEKNGTKLEKGI